MKKLIAVMLSLILLGSFALTASAADAYMSLSVSSGTVYRGDTFSVTVRLSNDQPVSNGGVILSYDSSAFEILGGSCHVSIAALAEVSAGRNGGGFVLQTDAVVSGTIFTIEMRVKDGASFGSYSISGSGSLNGAGCGVSGAGITVACRHSFENCTRVDGDTHESTCSICGEKKADSHTWDAGTVTKAATCKDTGTMHHTCTGCGAEKTEIIPANDDHKYGTWSKADDSKHTRQCSVCGKKDTASHTWNSGKVTKEATCQETGSRELKCTACGAQKTEQIPKTDHTYTPWAEVDDKSHSRSCSVCQKEETADHGYGEAWEHDDNGHFKTCVCGHVDGWAVHVPGPEPTETTDQLCTVCSRVLRPNTAHVHQFPADWSYDDLGHWHKCSQCDEKTGFAAHAFADDCDGECDVCGYTRTAPHVPEEVWTADESGHRKICAQCGEDAVFEDHIPGEPATTSSAQNCMVCGFELAGVLPHDHVYNAVGSVHTHACACGETYEADALTCEVCLAENKPFPWWIVCIGEAVIFSGVIMVLLLRGKKKQKTEE